MNPTTLVSLLEFRASETPNKTVYTWLNNGEEVSQTITYEQLHKQAKAIASGLSHAAGSTVLLLYPPGLDFVTAFFGCLYAAAIPVPTIPPRLNRPMPRLQSIIKDSGANIALTTEEIKTSIYRRQAEEQLLQSVMWQTIDEISTTTDNTWRYPDIDSDTLAFIQYTSGSTNNPKGVMVSHKNILHNAAAVYTAAGHNADESGVNWLPLYHDMGLIGGVIQTIYCGGHNAMMSPLDFLQKPVRWLQAITQYQAVTSMGPNFAYKLCAEKVTPEQCEGLDLSSLRALIVGAEPIHCEVMEQFARTFADYGFRREAFLPAYGLAESTLIVTGHRHRITNRFIHRKKLEEGQVQMVDPDDAHARAIVSCGKPVLDQTLLIVSPETCQVCPPGHVGEIWGASPSVALGYWNQPDITEHVFSAYPASGHEVGPFLRTGDLGFVYEDELYITGRLKDLIIIRGRNHYAEDIEQQVRTAHPAIDESAAFAISADFEEQLVIVASVKRSHRKADYAEVSRAIRTTVFDHHVVYPYDVILLSPGHMPRTSSGKIQRHAARDGYLDGSLQEIYRESQSTSKGSVGVNTATQSIIEDIWRDILGIEKIAPQDNFLSLGGQSLLVTQAATRLREKTGLDITPIDIFEHPTVASLADYVDILLETHSTSHIPPVTPVPRDGPLPLSYSQQRMWYLYQLAPESAAYNVSVCVRISGTVNHAVMQRCVNGLVERHESIRTVFPAVNGIAQQQIIEAKTLPINVVDLQEAPDKGRRVLELATQEAAKPFDLAQWPLIRFTMYRLAPDEHMVLVVMHHIISDAWSMTVIWDELIAMYNADGSAEVLPEMPVQMADFAHWQRRWLVDDVLSGQKHYWHQQLADATTVLELPTDFPRPLVQTYNGAQHIIELPPGLLDELRQFSQHENVTLFMTLFAAFATLLYHYTYQDDMVIGVPIANRQHLPTESLIGSFVNMLPMRIQFTPGMSLRDVIHQVRAMSLNAYAHQDYPFEKLVEELPLQRDTSRSPLIQVMFSLANVPDRILKVENLNWEFVPLDNASAQFDLSLAVTDTANIQVVSLTYNTDLFNADTITRFITNFKNLLQTLVVHADMAVLTYPILEEDHARQVLVIWNNNTQPYPDKDCVHTLIENQVAQTPSRVAAIFDNEEITYSELNRRANQLAYTLQARGVGPEMLVGVCVERSIEMLVAVLAVMKSGAAYVPLDPDFPQERLQLIIEDAGIQVSVTQYNLKDRLPQSYPGEIIYLDHDHAQIAAQPDTNLLSAVKPDNLMYVIYTSGSTGRPKGVEIEHRQVVNFLNAVQKRPGLVQDDVLLAVTTLSFDIAVLELYLPLVVGACVVIASHNDTVDSISLASLIYRHQVSVLQATPATWRSLVNIGWQGKHDLKALCGGEALPGELVGELLPRVGSLWNMYGPTETTVWSTVHAVEDIASPILIGKPIDNTDIYIFNAALKPVPIGVRGDLYIGGAGVARGYHNRDELNTERFIADPYNSGKRLFKTGDVARYLSDGTIELFGRIDNLVKIRGHRIELGDIESALAQHPQVKQAVIAVDKDPQGYKRLVGYIVLAAEEALSVEEIRQFLSGKLPAYMLPTLFTTVDKLPLTPNGKIDRLALPAITQPLVGEGYTAPRTALETRLSELWAEILHIEQVGIEDDFFQLGGHSLIAVQLMARIEREFGKRIPMTSLLQAPTVAAFASIIEHSKAPFSSLVPIQTKGDRLPLFLMHIRGGHVMFYNELARYLGDDQPVYGLQPRGIGGNAPYHRRIEDMAAHYIQEMRTIQPHGPYLIGGSSVGGLIAYEVAQQLHENGEEIALMVMFDTYGPGYPKRHPKVERLAVLYPLFSFYRRLYDFVETLILLPSGQRGSYLRARLERAVRQFKIRTGIKPEPNTFMSVMDEAYQAYQPRAYPGKVTLFRGTQQPLGVLEDDLLGWGTLPLNSLEIHRIRGSHGAMMVEPRVRYLSAKLEPILQDIHAQMKRTVEKDAF